MSIYSRLSIRYGRTAGTTLLAVAILAASGCTLSAQQAKNEVRIIGQMKDVMWGGRLQGKINLDTITDKQHLYGLGPLEYLAGEIVIVDGRAYRSTVLTDTTMQVAETYNIKAPFFCYAHIPDWTAQTLPDSVQTIPQLEAYLDRITDSLPRPFMFRLSGTVEQAVIHIVDLPAGSPVNSPEDAHKGQKNYELRGEEADIIGFFSTGHKAIFTHHDTYLHMHLITTDRQKMGHLDKVMLRSGTTRLYLPVQ